jgi:hypothetical protein
MFCWGGSVTFAGGRDSAKHTVEYSTGRYLQYERSVSRQKLVTSHTRSPETNYCSPQAPVANSAERRPAEGRRRASRRADLRDTQPVTGRAVRQSRLVHWLSPRPAVAGAAATAMTVLPDALMIVWLLFSICLPHAAMGLASRSDFDLVPPVVFTPSLPPLSASQTALRGE